MGLRWKIHISCHHKPMGPPIQVHELEVRTKLAAVKVHTDPIGWEAEAYPVIESYATNGD